ncbi:amino acid transporter [Paraphotobacterium marinum]|uniref:Amino acid transporter n=1 Tax=Paraphotobacterium marinum TaxID=1755811 RepID=A0A220VFA8_9GAMM|nr:APC family permease [Paraphotobacterium marinum]ASK79047.1 amino acid transporter [Paraphotobacterium marinum]
MKNKKISMVSAIALSATCMIGSGWLFSAQKAAQQAGNYAFLAWILAAVMVLAVGMCLCKVVEIYPVRGATTRSSALSHNHIFGMPFAFANWFGIMVTVATEAQATTQYLSDIFKNSPLMGDDGLTLYGKCFALFILAVYLFINFYGIKLLAKVNNIVMALKIFTPLFAIVVLLIVHFDKTNFSLASNSMFHATSAIGAIVGAGLIYSFNGFQTVVAFASEVENPKKNVPKSIIYSIGIVLVVYMLLQLSFMGAVPKDSLQSGWAALNFHSPLLDLALLLGINFLAMLLLADSVVSPSGTGYTYLGAASRMMYAMAKEGQMPGWIAKLCPVYNFSKRSMVINFLLAAVFLLNAKSWASLMVIVTGYHIIGYMAAPVSMTALKPKTFVFGIVVFTLLGLLMTTIPGADLLKMNGTITLLMAIYFAIQVKKKENIKQILMFTIPFLVYLWLLLAFQPYWYVTVVLSVVFFSYVTHQKYVQAARGIAEEYVDDEEVLTH